MTNNSPDSLLRATEIVPLKSLYEQLYSDETLQISSPPRLTFDKLQLIFDDNNIFQLAEIPSSGIIPIVIC